MDESVTDEGCRQSILKPRNRFPLQEVQPLFPDDDCTVTNTLTRSRRVSFGRKLVKEFIVGSAVSTKAVHEYEQSSESLSDPSECSGPLDLAFDKTNRDKNVEVEHTLEPPECSDAKSRDPEQRARIFTENCISIAKSVFQDNETELTAIIIGAKPTAMDENKRSSSCMSFTTLGMSNMSGVEQGHKGSDSDFPPVIRHSEMVFGHDSSYQIDHSRFEFLDNSIGSVAMPGVKLVRQGARTPLAPLSQKLIWEVESEENIPPAHSGFSVAPRAASSEHTMEFTCANVRAKSHPVNYSGRPSSGSHSDMNETCCKSLNNFTEKSVNISNGETSTQAVAEDVEDPLRLDVTRDDFLLDLSGLEGQATLTQSPSDSDDSPFAGLQKELANLSVGNQSFRERVQTLSGLNMSRDSGKLDPQMNFTTLESPGVEFLSPPESQVSFLATTLTRIRCAAPVPNAVLNDSMLEQRCRTPPGDDEMELTEVNASRWQPDPNLLDPLGSDETLTRAENSMFSPDESVEAPEALTVSMEMTAARRSILIENGFGTNNDIPSTINKEMSPGIARSNKAQPQKFLVASALAEHSDVVASAEVQANTSNDMEETGIFNMEAPQRCNIVTEVFRDCSLPVKYNDVTLSMGQSARSDISAQDLPVLAQASFDELDPLSTPLSNNLTQNLPYTSIENFKGLCVTETIQNQCGNAPQMPSGDDVNGIRVISHENGNSTPYYNNTDLEVGALAPNQITPQADALIETALYSGGNAEAASQDADDIEPHALPLDVSVEVPEFGKQTDRTSNELSSLGVTIPDTNAVMGIVTSSNAFEEPAPPSMIRDSSHGFTLTLNKSDVAETAQPGISLSTQQTAIVNEETPALQNCTFGRPSLSHPTSIHDNGALEAPTQAMVNSLDPLQANHVETPTHPDVIMEIPPQANDMVEFPPHPDIAIDFPSHAKVTMQAAPQHDKTNEAAHQCNQEVSPAANVTMPASPQQPGVTTETQSQVTYAIAVVPQVGNVTDAAPQPNVTVEVPPPGVNSADLPLNTPLAGLAALSTRPSLRDRLLAAPPESTTGSMCIEDALRSMDLTEGTMGGLVPRLMKTMSDEQCMRAIHESTRVQDSSQCRPSLLERDLTYRVHPGPSEETYILKVAEDHTAKVNHFGEGTYTAPNASETALKAMAKRASTSPSPGERLKKIRQSHSPRPLDMSKPPHGIVHELDDTVPAPGDLQAFCAESPQVQVVPVNFPETVGKRIHSDSPLPIDKLMKRTRLCNSPSVARSLEPPAIEPAVDGAEEEDVNTDVSYLGPARYSLEFDTSVTLQDVTLMATLPFDHSMLRTETSFAVAQISTPRRSTIPAHLQTSSTLASAFLPDSPTFGAMTREMSITVPNVMVPDVDDEETGATGIAEVSSTTCEAPQDNNVTESQSSRQSPMNTSPSESFTLESVSPANSATIATPLNESETSDKLAEYPNVEGTIDSSTREEEPSRRSEQQTCTSDVLCAVMTPSRGALNSSSKSDANTSSSEQEMNVTEIERVTAKVRKEMEEQSREDICVWKMVSLNPCEDGFMLAIELPLLETKLLLNILFKSYRSSPRVIDHNMQHLPSRKYQMPVKIIANDFGYETLKKYIAKELKKIVKFEEIPYFLDILNAFSRKLTSLMQDTLTVLRGYAGSRLNEGQWLSFRLHSYPTLMSCWVDIDLNDLLALGELRIKFRHETGLLDEMQIRALLPQATPPLLQSFVRLASDFIIRQEAISGFITRRPKLLF